ncbi:MAG: MBL fold metallo-hydrolase [Oscillospiraceae bacterium]|nr:MBL fold metallo-hydrolase [Oscillospiraceae bacterium]
MIRFATLASGSSGNCTAVWNDEGLVLIDMGISCRRTISALNSLGFSVSDVSSVLITHEHIDHVAGLKVFCSHYDIELCGTASTKRYLLDNGMIHPFQRFREFTHGECFSAGGFNVDPFPTSHDSRTCTGFRLGRGDKAVAVVTDVGRIDDLIREKMHGCGIVALESNYDDMMLTNGQYAPSLKARIRSPRGHLSNADCAREVARLVTEENVGQVVLMHLSDKNNTPQLALVSCISAAEDMGMPEDRYRIIAAPRSEISEILELD